MVDTTSNAGLRLKATRARAEQEARSMSPARALRLATEKTADASFSLVLTVQSIGRDQVNHAGLLKLIPDGVLLLLLDGPDGALGVMTLDAAMLAALIEMQTVGQVSAKPPQVRPLTRTDAAMVAPLVDGILHRMSQYLVGHPDGYWACGFRYGAMIDDRRSLGMALAAPDFHVFQLPLDIADGTRSGAVILALPQRAAPVVPADKHESAQVSVPLQQRVLDAPVRLDAILCRLSLPLSDVGRLAVGDVLALPKDALREIAIESVGRQAVATARLGQMGGMRALRLTVPGHIPAPHPVEASADPAPPPPTAPPPPVPTPTLDQWNEDAGDPMSYGLDDGHAAA